MGSNPDPKRILDELLGDYELQGAIYAVAKLGIADLLNDGPKSYQNIASKLNINPQATAKTMRYLSDNQVFRELGYGNFELTDVGRLLRAGVQREDVVVSFEVRRPVAHDHLYTLKTGDSAFEHVHGMSWYEYAAKHSDFEDSFIRFMNKSTIGAADSIMGAYDFGRYATMVDVGGNIGALLAAILLKYPKLRGVLLDRMSTIEKAKTFMEGQGLLDRCELIAGNFLEAVPRGGDIYMLKWVLTDWEDKDFVRILRNCHQAMNSNGRVLIIEWVLEESNSPSPSRALDHWLMLIGRRGCRTLSEVDKLLLDAGFKSSSPIRTSSGFTIVEGRRR